MAQTCYEMAASVLLCAEDSSSVLGFGEEEEEEGDVVYSGTTKRRCEEDGAVVPVDFPVASEECVVRLVETEAEHMPREDFAERLRVGGLDLGVRMDAVDWIWKVHSYYSFGPLTACLAVNYLDRFLSFYQLPEGRPWMTQLLSVACLSLAAKMEESSVPQSLDLQVGEARYVFEAKTIQRMELLVLSTLKWRMQAVTPFSYLDYYLHELNGGNAPSRRSALQSADLILCISRGTHCLDFRPSEIAAAVAATVVGEEHNADTVTSCSHVDKERVSRCREVIQEAMGLTGAVTTMAMLQKSGSYTSRASVPRSPTRVLDAGGCLSYKSDDSTIDSHASGSFDCSPVSSKRRKISR